MPATKVREKRFRSGHVIENYSISANTIECACTWFGDAGKDWTQHKNDMKNNPVERETWMERSKKATGQIPF